MEQAYTITHNQAVSIQGDPELEMLYKTYAAKLLGYVLAVVKNRETAEDCLVKIFTDIYRRKQNGIDTRQSNTWCWLMNLARRQINALQETTQDCLKNDVAAGFTDDCFLNKMSAEQQQVFCGVYYHRKTVIQLAAELDMAEPTVRQKLKEAFTIIRVER